MKYLLLAYVVAGLIGVCLILSYPNNPVVVPLDRDATLWSRGRIAYKVRCVSCHNPNPDLPGSTGPKLRGVSEELLTDRLTNGKAGMPAQPDFVRFVPALREYLR